MDREPQGPAWDLEGCGRGKEFGEGREIPAQPSGLEVLDFVLLDPAEGTGILGYSGGMRGLLRHLPATPGLPSTFCTAQQDPELPGISPTNTLGSHQTPPLGRGREQCDPRARD